MFLISPFKNTCRAEITHFIYKQAHAHTHTLPDSDTSDLRRRLHTRADNHRRFVFTELFFFVPFRRKETLRANLPSYFSGFNHRVAQHVNCRGLSNCVSLFGFKTSAVYAAEAPTTAVERDAEWERWWHDVLVRKHRSLFLHSRVFPRFVGCVFL